jgi:restriction endonuclease S subunit
MADLTSLYRNKPKRDFSIQACVDCINQIALQFPGQFKEGLFTDYFDIAGGTQPPKSRFINEPREGYVKFLQIRDFASDTTPTFIPNSKNNKLCIQTDLVIGRYGASVGKILTGKAGAYNVACAKIIFIKDEEVDKDFLFYWLHSSYFQNFLTSISRSAQGGFNKNDLSRIQTLFPSIEIQRKLTTILKIIDSALINGDKIIFNKNVENEIELSFIGLIEKFLSFINEGEELATELTDQLTLVKKLRHQLLLDAVQGKLVEQNKKDELASELLKKITVEKQKLIADKKLKKEIELPAINPEELPFEIPENWVWCRLGEICTVEKGLIGIQKAVDGDFPLIVTGEDRLSHNDYHFDGKAVIVPLVSSTGHGHASLKRIHYQEGQFAVGNILGCIMTLMPHYLNMAFLYHYLDCYKELFFINKMKGAANVSLKISSIKETPIPLIPIEIQNKYEELMQYCDELELSIKESQLQNEKLLQQVLREALRKGPILENN